MKKKYTVYTNNGDYKVEAYNEYGAKRIVWNLLFGRVDMKDMIVVCNGNSISY